MAAFINSFTCLGSPANDRATKVAFEINAKVDDPLQMYLTDVLTVSINLVSILSEHHWRAALRDYWPIPAFTIVGSFLGTQVLLI